MRLRRWVCRLVGLGRLFRRRGFGFRWVYMIEDTICMTWNEGWLVNARDCSCDGCTPRGHLLLRRLRMRESEHGCAKEFHRRQRQRKCMRSEVGLAARLNRYAHCAQQVTTHMTVSRNVEETPRSSTQSCIRLTVRILHTSTIYTSSPRHRARHQLDKMQYEHEKDWKLATYRTHVASCWSCEVKP